MAARKKKSELATHTTLGCVPADRDLFNAIRDEVQERLDVKISAVAMIGLVLRSTSSRRIIECMLKSAVED